MNLLKKALGIKEGYEQYFKENINAGIEQYNVLYSFMIELTIGEAGNKLSKLEFNEFLKDLNTFKLLLLNGENNKTINSKLLYYYTNLLTSDKITKNGYILVIESIIKFDKEIEKNLLDFFNNSEEYELKAYTALSLLFNLDSGNLLKFLKEENDGYDNRWVLNITTMLSISKFLRKNTELKYSKSIGEKMFDKIIGNNELSFFEIVSKLRELAIEKNYEMDAKEIKSILIYIINNYILEI